MWIRPEADRVHRAQISRRDMLAKCSTGFGLVALSGFFGANKTFAAANTPLIPTPFAPRPPHFNPKVKSVIFCFMSGGVSHVDTFDPKPRLKRDHGKPMPVPVRPTMFNQNGNIMASPWEFQNHGRSGLPISELFPHIATCADDLAVIRSMTSIANEHAQGNYFLHTGFSLAGFPSAGAWTSYGLGSENQNLPAFVVLASGGSPLGGINNYGNGFLPALHQASFIDPTQEEPLANITPREADSIQRKRLNFISRQDRRHLTRLHGNEQVESAIQNYEIAYRMQSKVPDLVDLRGESEATKQLYGMDSPVREKAEYGRQCLLARRLVERGVRFVELTCLPRPADPGQIGNPWDQHGVLKAGHSEMAFQVDQPIAGLIKDLKARGLFEETLIVWAGEFGRTPFAQSTDGRDHNPFGFSVWLAGGGVRGGTAHGATDDLGYYAVEEVCTVYDLWATVQHLLGLNHEQLTYRFGGRDYRLTDVHGQVIRPILA
ncbi:MAG: DUF1501 domain-containing protein [Verrucomicrobiales bacterium]|nr:DUF1501 domain-containing protein [Verrucomicrobiales bacterium]